MEQKEQDADTHSGIFGRWFKKEDGPSSEEFEEDLNHLLAEGRKSGLLQESEVMMIHNILAFAREDVKDIMIHRPDIAALDGAMCLKDALDIMAEGHFSRYPVYLSDLDNIIGIIHIRDAFKFVEEGKNSNRPLRDLDELVKPAVFVPETHSINKLFAQMQHTKNHLVIVQDEYGQTSGILSMEDILEEIVGNIQDEYDEDDEQIAENKDGTFIMDGGTPLDEVSQTLGIDFGDDESETLNGYLLERLGYIPEEHKPFTVSGHGYTFHAADVEGMVARKVYIRPTQKGGSLDSDTHK